MNEGDGRDLAMRAIGAAGSAPADDREAVTLPDEVEDRKQGKASVAGRRPGAASQHETTEECVLKASDKTGEHRLGSRLDGSQAGSAHEVAERPPFEVLEVARKVELEPSTAEDSSLPAAEVRHRDREQPALTEELTRPPERIAWVLYVLKGVVEKDRVERSGGPGRVLKPAAVDLEAARGGLPARVARRLDAIHLPAAATKYDAELAAATADVEQAARALCRDRPVRTTDRGELEPRSIEAPARERDQASPAS